MDGNSRPVTRRDVLRGAAGAVGLAGASSTAAAQEGGGGNSSGSSGGNSSGGGGGSSGGGGGGSSGGGSATVEVGPNGNLTFVPGTNETLYIKPGTTVEFVWKSDNHNIVVGSQPSEASWEGTPGDQNKTYNSGYTYTHKFTVKGKYHYWCQPHKSLGMVGDIEVTDNPPENKGHTSILPKSAKTIGIATTGAMSSVLGLAYIFMKFGGDYSQGAEE